jgi:hypothetical protein
MLKSHMELMGVLTLKGGRLGTKCVFPNHVLFYIGWNYATQYIHVAKHGACSNEANEKRIFIS